MFFEGSEKKIEIQFRSSVSDLRQRPRQFWDELVSKSQAQILSVIENNDLTAYLLSESSLFVSSNDIVMITCGTTQLIKAAEFLFESFSQEDIEAFFYERKNEVFPQAQPSSFQDDVKVLKKWFPGEAMRFGREDEHHLYLFASTMPFQPPSNDHTMEILMHGVDPQWPVSYTHLTLPTKA